MKKIKLFLVFAILWAIPCLMTAQAQVKHAEPKNIINRMIDANGNEMVEIAITGKPPDFRMPEADAPSSAVLLSNVPAFDWSFGCSATSAAMMAAYYDRIGYYNMYTGPTQGGLIPMDNSSWGDVIINGETRHQCPLSATRNGVDGRGTRGHVDDYWISYGSAANDPYITNGWAQHAYGQCTGDYMKTNQSFYGNTDGMTTFWNYTAGAANCDDATHSNDGCAGLRDFFESRGYTVISNCNQYIYGYNGNTQGFTYTQYKAEIDAGRPVLIHIDDHTMLGFGYDNASNTVYLHDTWDYGTHTMTWGGTYGGATHYGVTTIHLSAVTPNPCSSVISLGNGGAANQKTYWGGGEGVWYNSSLNPCGFYTPGIEQVYSFVAPVSGYYSIQVTAASGYVDYLWRASSCASSGWNCIDDIYIPGTYGSIYMTSGSTYYLLLDDENNTEGQHDFYIFLNPCLNVTTITGTGSGYAQTYAGGGYGGWNTYTTSACEYACPGREKLYSFTPSTTGIYSVVVTSASSWVDYMWKTGFCSSTGWSCIDDIYSPGTYGAMNMTAGTTYYILLDDEDITAGAHNFYMTLAEAAGIWEGTYSTDWNNPSNWSASTLPTSSIAVVIPGSRPHQPTIGGGITAYAKSLTIQSGAILTQNATTSNYFYVYGNFNSDGGQFIMNGTTSYLYLAGSGDTYWDDDNGNDIYTNVFVVKTNSTDQLEMWQDMTCSGSFEVREGIFAIDATWTLTITNTSITAFQVESGGKLLLNDENINCSGGVVFYNGSQAEVNGGVIECGDDLTVNANTSYDIVFNGGTLLMDGSGTQYINDLDGGALQLYNLTIHKPFGMVYIKSANLDINNQLLIEQGTLSCNNGATATATYNINIGGNWFNSVGPPGFEESTGTVIVDGTIYTQYCYDENFYNLEVNKPTGGYFATNGYDVYCAHYNWTAGGGIVVYAGSFTAGDLIDNGLFGSYATFDGTLNLHNNDGWVDLHGILYIYGGTFNVYGGSGSDSYWPYMNDGAITMTNGVLDFKNVGVYIYTNTYALTENITGGTIRSARGFTVDRTDYTPTGGTVELYGSTDGILHTISGNVFNVLVNKSPADNQVQTDNRVFDRQTGSWTEAPLANTINIDNTTNISGDFTLQAGTVNAGANAIYVGGNWDNQVGPAAFNEGTSTVTFNGTALADILSDETFYNLYVQKTVDNFDGLELIAGLDLNVLYNLYIYDGCFELNINTDVNVTGSVGMLSGAGLNANDGLINIFVGNSWINYNTDYSTTNGFDPGNSSKVTFTGSTDQALLAEALSETFADLVINKPAGSFRSYDNITCRGDMEIIDGMWEDYVTSLHHTFNGNFTVQAAGVFNSTSYQNTVEFASSGNAVFTYLGGAGYFYNLQVNKSTGYGVTQVGNTSLQNGGSLTIDNGTYNMNGKYLHVSGDIAVNDAGILLLPASTDLRMTDANQINVNAGGRLEVAGTLANPATITANVSTARYAFNINPGGTIAADYGIFKNMSVNGVFVTPGSTVDPAHAFYGCTFQDGATGGTLLGINNAQTLTIRNAVFPTNTWTGASNVAKTLNSGQVYFVDFSGGFSGETYDGDGFGLIDWISTLTAVATAAPNPICAGSSTQLNVNRSGGLSPFTYVWSPTSGLSNPNIINPVATPVGTTNYNVTVTDALGTTKSSVVTVTVNPVLPVSVSIVASANPSPPSNWVTFTATPVNGGSSPSFQWKKNGLNVGSGGPVFSTNVLSYNDHITCVLTSNYACPTGNPATSNTITMIIVATNTAVNGTIPFGTSVCFDASNTITVGGPGGPFVIQNGGRAKMIAGVKISYLYGTRVQPGGYMWGYITTTNAYCPSVPLPMVAAGSGTSPAEGASADEVVASGTSATTTVGEVPEPTANFLLYPNPTTGSFTLQSNDPGFRGKVEVQVLTMRGERIITAGYEGERSHHFMLEGLPSGLYFVKVMAAGRVEPFKLIVTR